MFRAMFFKALVVTEMGNLHLLARGSTFLGSLRYPCKAYLGLELELIHDGSLLLPVV